MQSLAAKNKLKKDGEKPPNTQYLVAEVAAASG